MLKKIDKNLCKIRLIRKIRALKSILNNLNVYKILFMKKMFFYFSFLLAILYANQATAQNINFFEGTLAEAKAKAKYENKPLFVDIYAVWCIHCKKLDKKVFTQAAVSDYFNANFINFKMDAEKGEGIQFVKDNKIKAYPTLLFFDADGKTLLKNTGAVSSEKLLSKAKTALNSKP